MVCRNFIALLATAVALAMTPAAFAADDYQSRRLPGQARRRCPVLSCLEEGNRRPANDPSVRKIMVSDLNVSESVFDDVLNV